MRLSFGGALVAVLKLIEHFAGERNAQYARLRSVVSM